MKKIDSSSPLENFKFALISGASSGIGRALAHQLAAQGMSLILLARRQERLDEVKNQILKTHPRVAVETLLCDLSDQKQVEALFENHSDLLKHVNVLINNAGLAKGTEPVQKSKWSDWDQMISTNIQGLFHLTQKMLPLLEKHTQAHIINLGSVAGRLVYPGGAVYCATKFAVRAFTEGLRMDLLGKNIRVTNIEPGMVNSEFSLVRLGDQQKADQVYSGMTPLSPEDIAETILWTLSRPAHVNIQELVIYPTDQASVGQVSRKT